MKGAEAFTMGRGPRVAAVRVSLWGAPSLAALDRGLTAFRGVLDGGPAERF